MLPCSGGDLEHSELSPEDRSYHVHSEEHITSQQRGATQEQGRSGEDFTDGFFGPALPPTSSQQDAILEDKHPRLGPLSCRDGGLPFTGGLFLPIEAASVLRSVQFSSRDIRSDSCSTAMAESDCCATAMADTAAADSATERSKRHMWGTIIQRSAPEQCLSKQLQVKV